MTVSNKKIAAGFVAAKQYLWDGEEERSINKTQYICTALKRACDKKEISRKVFLACTSIISSRLDGKSTLKFWLNARGICAWELTATEVQVHRHAWLDLLIKEFSE